MKKVASTSTLNTTKEKLFLNYNICYLLESSSPCEIKGRLSSARSCHWLTDKPHTHNLSPRKIGAN